MNVMKCILLLALVWNNFQKDPRMEKNVSLITVIIPFHFWDEKQVMVQLNVYCSCSYSWT